MTDRSTSRLKVELARVIAAGSRRARAVFRGADRLLEKWTAGLLEAAMDVEEKEALSVALYDDAFQPELDFPGLYPWEETWFSRRLPPPPARILVGAAGGGREAVALGELGYTVVAMEPSKRAAAHSRRRLAGDAKVVQASYRELVDAVLDGASSVLELTPGSRFDAVLLGWGSFGHILREEERLRLLETCALLCPEGPILLSVFAAPSSDGSDRAFFTWGGFLAIPSADELANHASALGRELVASLDTASPYFTLIPKADAGTIRAEPSDRGNER